MTPTDAATPTPELAARASDRAEPIDPRDVPLAPAPTQAPPLATLIAAAVIATSVPDRAMAASTPPPAESRRDAVGPRSAPRAAAVPLLGAASPPSLPGPPQAGFGAQAAEAAATPLEAKGPQPSVPEAVAASPLPEPIVGPVTMAADASLRAPPPADLAAPLPKAPAAPAHPEPIVAAQPGQIGRDVGVEIARRLSAGGDELVVRLMPPEMGRIEVRMSFDSQGGLRAVIAADSPVALDMLRRDSADLSRSLTDAGVRSDAQSLRFQTDGGSSGGQNAPRSPWASADARFGRSADQASGEDAAPVAYRHIRTSGTYNLLA